MSYNIALKLGDTTFHTIGCLFTSEEEIKKETKRHKEKTNLISVYLSYNLYIYIIANSLGQHETSTNFIFRNESLCHKIDVTGIYKEHYS